MTKVRTGQADRIRPCVGANQGCVDRMHLALPITCFHNPDVGREHRLPPVPAGPAGPADPPGEARRVLVVGAGPAGMKAAQVAAARGHHVRLVDERDRLGGRLHSATTFGPAAELAGAIGWLARELERLGVRPELGRRLDVDAVVTAAADVVVLATGSSPPADPLPGADGSIPVWTTDEAMARDAGGLRVLVIDLLGTHESAQAAERVADAGATVVLATPGQVVGAALGFTHVKAQLRRFAALGVDLRTSQVLTGISGGQAALRHVHTRQVSTEPYDAVVAAVHRTARADLQDALRERAPDLRVLLAGDAVAPRTAMHAFREGDAVGRAA